MKIPTDRITSKRWRLSAIGFQMVVILCLIGCKSPEPIKIGIVGTFSGPGSDLSVSGRRGAELAMEAINEKGGIDGRLIKLVYKDDENSPEKALLQQKLFQAEGIKLIIGHATSNLVLSTIDYVNNQDTLLLGPTISSDLLSKKNDNFIRFMASTKEQAVVLSKASVDRNHQRILVLFDERNKGYADQLVNNYVSLIKDQLGFSPIVQAYDPSKPSSVKKAIDLMMKSLPEGMLVVASAEDSAAIAHYVKKMPQPPQLYGPLWSNTAELIRKGGHDIDGMLLVGGIDTEANKPAYIAFHEIFVNSFGEEPTFASLYTYETLMAVAQAIDKANSIEPQKVKEKIIEIRKFEGLQSSFEIDTYGDNTRAYMLFEVQDGKVRKVDTR